MNAILEKIRADLNGKTVMNPMEELICSKGRYYPTAKSYASPKYSNGQLAALTFLIQHPSILIAGDKMKRESVFTDLSSAVANAYQQAGQQMMQKHSNLSNLDFCICPKQVEVRDTHLALAVINGMYSDIDIQPNWNLSLMEKHADIVINGKKVNGTIDVSSDKLRIFGANSPYPLFVGKIDWDNCEITVDRPHTQTIPLAKAVDAIGKDPRVMRPYRNMPEEILVKRLESLWDFMKDGLEETKHDYFDDGQLKVAYLEECYDSLTGKLTESISIDVSVVGPMI